MFLASITAFLNGTPGAKHHLGYGMLSRAAFGMWGSYFCIMLNVFQSFVFYVSSSILLLVKSEFGILEVYLLMVTFREHKCSLGDRLL